MTNSTTSANHSSAQAYKRPAAKSSDEAPMVITHLSGWIDMSEPRHAQPEWIVRTRMATPAR